MFNIIPIFSFLLISNLFIIILCNKDYLLMDKEMETPLKAYLNYSFSGNLKPGLNLEKVEKPKISIIIPMYNEEKNVLKVIRTVQNQNKKSKSFALMIIQTIILYKF